MIDLGPSDGAWAMAAVETVTVMGAVWDPSEAPDSVSYRTKGDDGGWGAWEEFELADGAGPDDGTAEAAGYVAGTEPVVVADGETVEVRVEGSSSSAVSMDTVTTSTTSADEQIAQNSSYAAPGESDDPLGLVPLASAGASTARAGAGGFAAAPAAKNAGLTYVSRAEWGANEKLKKCDPDLTSTNRAMVVHHTAGATNYSRSQVPGILRGILSYHTQSRGWCDIGYNMLIDRFGTIYEGRSGGLDRAVVGAHASGFNSGTFGVSVMGTYTSPAPAAAVDALGRVGAWQAGKWGWDPTTRVELTSGGGSTTRFPEGRQVTLPRIFGHRDTSHTECPGKGLYGQLGQVRTKAKAGMPPPADASAITKFHHSNSAMTGAPMTAEKCGLVDGGCFRKFQKGSVHWSQKSGAHFTRAGGAIQRRWGSDGWERGPLGYPRGKEFTLRDRTGGTAQHFTGGTITRTASTGAWALVGDIGKKWKASGWERGDLRLPTSNQKCGLVRGGCFQKFEGGSVHWSPASGAHITRGRISKAWGSQKWERGRLGFPTSDEYRKGTDIRQDFEGGYVLWSSSAGARTFFT